MDRQSSCFASVLRHPIEREREAIQVRRIVLDRDGLSEPLQISEGGGGWSSDLLPMNREPTRVTGLIGRGRPCV
jgi:hypothetical protein